MNERVKKLIKPMILLGFTIFVVCCLINRPMAFEDYSAYVGYAISGVTVLFVVYERFLWKFIPWNRPPVLEKEYEGMLAYTYKKQPETKPISITVKQTWLSVKITTKTDTNASYTVTGTITYEHGVDVLYYTYITEPLAVQQNKNPIQYGTCRMILDNQNKAIRGKYWTSSQTVGDLEWNEISEDRE